MNEVTDTTPTLVDATQAPSSGRVPTRDFIGSQDITQLIHVSLSCVCSVVPLAAQVRKERASFDPIPLTPTQHEMASPKRKLLLTASTLF